MQLIVAEKPSVARDLARVLDVPASGRTCFRSETRVITWCVGHLVELDEPVAYHAGWRAWRLETLPMLPGEFRLRPAKRTRDQFEAVARLLRDRRFREVVNACDAGREGELIFRYLVQAAGGRLPIRRLWISSLTEEAIRKGFAALKPGEALLPLADAARCRSEADWLVGLNATRAMTVRGRTGGESTLFSIGRVQTPTLALLVARERAIEAFVPRDFFEVEGAFARPGEPPFRARFSARGVTRFGPRAAAETIVARCNTVGKRGAPGGPRVARVEKKLGREPPPLLFDLTSLQRTANRRFGLSAARTLAIAQALYETHKLLTYPRTDSRHLPADVVPTLPKLFAALATAPDYAPFAAPLVATPPRIGKRVCDETRVRDHHAIIPTGRLPRAGARGLERDESKVFDLVVRRFLGAFFPDAEFAHTRVELLVGAGTRLLPERAVEDAAEARLDAPPSPPDLFVARGRVRLAAGWQAVAGFGDEPAGSRERAGEDEDEAAPLLPDLAEGERLDARFAVRARQTRPPARHTEATLLQAMESAGRAIEDEVLREAMKEGGLGTPATRASILETLLDRGYMRREQKHLVPTATGMSLVAAIPIESLKSAELTGQWEARLSRIARGEESRPRFMADIATYVREIVDAIRAAPPPQASRERPAAATAMPGQRGRPGAPRAPASRARDRATTPRRQAATAAPPVAKRRASGGALGQGVGDLRCPRCGEGELIIGRRGWGCSRWREGCRFVVWFEAAGRRVTEAQLRDLVRCGRTRKGKWPADGGPAVSGRLVLDPAATSGSARLVIE